MPRRYVIHKRGIIGLADANADRKIRPEPSKTLKSVPAIIGRLGAHS